MTGRGDLPAARRRVRTALAALGLPVALVAGAALAAPAQASEGVFLYTDGSTGLPAPLVAPPELTCIAAPKGSGAHNYTRSDVILYGDEGCEIFLLVLVPGESLNMSFNSVGFAPAGGRTPPPAQRRLPAAR